MTSQATYDVYSWSQEEYSLVDLWKKSKDDLPLLVKVTSGYYGSSMWETLSTHEILLIGAVGKHSRVVAKDDKGRNFSIPQKYPKRFNVVGSKPGKKPLDLSKVMQQYGLPVRVQMEQTGSAAVLVGDRPGRTVPVSEWELFDVYDERYIKANSLTRGELDRETILVPLFVKVYVCIAEGLTSGGHKEWTAWKKKYAQFVKALDLDKIKPSQDINYYSSQMMVDDMDLYDTIEPSQYYSLLQDRPVHNYVGVKPKPEQSGIYSEVALSKEIQELEKKEKGSKTIWHSKHVDKTYGNIDEVDDHQAGRKASSEADIYSEVAVSEDINREKEKRKK